MATANFSFISKIKTYFSNDLWHYVDASEKNHKSLSILRVIFQTCLQFHQRKMGMIATAMTFYTLMSIVPILALTFAIAKGFHLQVFVESKIHALPLPPEVLNQFIAYADKALQQASSVGIAGVGAILLFWSVLRLFSVIEKAFNDIWHIQRGRSMVRCLTDYLAMLFFFLFAITTMSACTYFVQSFLPHVLAVSDMIPMKEDILVWSAQLTSILILAVIFGIIYMAIPHTRVKFIPAFISGVVVAIALFVLTQYAVFGILNIAKLNAIYGSLAPLPIFLLWLNFSWMIVLFGSQLGYVIQNIHVFAYRKEWTALSTRDRHLCMLLVLREVAIRFDAHHPPVSTSELSSLLRLPLHIVDDVLHALLNAQLISNVTPPRDKVTDSYWQLACNSNTLTIADALLGLEHKGIPLPEKLSSPLTVAMNSELEKLEKALRLQGKNILIQIQNQS